MLELSKSKQRGMTYLELIIVLSIFGVVSAIVVFSYKEFQAKVDINNLVNEVALKVVEAQKSATSGKLSPLTSDSLWKPSYGVYFDVDTPTQFIYFTDVNNLNGCDDPQCLPASTFPYYSIGGEVTDVITITRGNFIPTNGIEVVGTVDTFCPPTINSVSLTFKRPNSAPTITTNPSVTCTISYVSITFSSSASATDKLRLYPSGRIQID